MQDSIVVRPFSKAPHVSPVCQSVAPDVPQAVLQKPSQDLLRQGANILREGVQGSLSRKLSLQTSLALTARILGLKGSASAPSMEVDGSCPPCADASPMQIWFVVGHLQEANQGFVDAVEADDGFAALVQVAQDRSLEGGESCALFAAISQRTGEIVFPSDENYSPVNAGDLLAVFDPAY